jgi:hypothetical protein
MLRSNCQWHCPSCITTNRLLQELGANVRPTMGPIGTPCGNRVWGIRCLLQKYYGQAVIRHRPEELLLPDFVGPTQPTSASFVYDTTTCATDDNHNLEPIPSTVRGLTQEEDSLVARMEVIIQSFLDLLQVMGGDLSPEKCAWYLIGHRWNKGVPQLIQVEPHYRSIIITLRSSGLI